ncbi:MAG: hypothetical protein ACQEQI_01005 [Bacillota bacterium]
MVSNLIAAVIFIGVLYLVIKKYKDGDHCAGCEGCSTDLTEQLADEDKREEGDY